jgi:YfiH family protein
MDHPAENMSILRFANIDPRLFFHGVFSRSGGVSPPPYDSLNLSHGVGDFAGNVEHNRRRLKRQFHIDLLVSSRQVHGDRVLVIDRRPSDDQEIQGYDALITDLTGVGLMVQQADCQAVLLVDAKRRLAGICHVGWRGSVQGIIGKTITAMHSSFGSQPGDLSAAISPSLGPCCAEFVNYRKELPRNFWKFEVSPNKFDFWAISSMQLQEAGVAEENIETAGICTLCSEAYFSYRRNKITGRFASVVGIHDK